MSNLLSTPNSSFWSYHLYLVTNFTPGSKKLFHLKVGGNMLTLKVISSESQNLAPGSMQAEPLS